MVDSKAYRKALDLLQQASTPKGFVAAVQEFDNYKRVWTRDGMVTCIAALLSGESNLIQTAKTTIETLFSNQHKNGFMPSNVSADGSVSYGGTSGRADNPSWAVIGLCAYSLVTEDQTLWNKYQREVEKCFEVLEAWEFNGKHLIYVPQSGDWADEYIQHGYILFDQLLRLWALKLCAKLSPNQYRNEKARQINKAIETNFWNVDGKADAYAPNLSHQLKGSSAAFWLMGFNPARVYKYFDLQANVFCLLLGIGNEENNRSVIEFLKNFNDGKQSMLPSFYPTIAEDSADMNELRNNYAYSFRNKPGYFHNGGLWPVWNGFLSAALSFNGEHDFAKAILSAVHNSNASADFFNECLQGFSQQPCGVPNCTWSAAGAVIAEQALVNDQFKQLFTFNEFEL